MATACILKKYIFSGKTLLLLSLPGFINVAQQRQRRFTQRLFQDFTWPSKKGNWLPRSNPLCKPTSIPSGKNLYHKRHFNKFQKNEQQTDQFPIEGQTAWMDIKHENEAKRYLVKKLLGTIDEKCRELLEMYYIKGFSSEAIAENPGFGQTGGRCAEGGLIVSKNCGN